MHIGSGRAGLGPSSVDPAPGTSSGVTVVSPVAQLKSVSCSESQFPQLDTESLCGSLFGIPEPELQDRFRVP